MNLDDWRIRRSARAHGLITAAIDEAESSAYRAALAYREFNDKASHFNEVAADDIRTALLDSLYYGRLYLRTLSDRVRDNGDLTETHREQLFARIDSVRSETSDLI